MPQYACKLQQQPSAHSVVEKIDRNVVRTAAILKIVPYANLC